MKSRRSILIVLVALAVIAAVWSTLLIVAPGRQTLDTRVQRVASQLKCLICQGESVADSPSTLARQMRTVIREQLQSGKSEQDIIRYFEQRYGPQIVWSPPWQGFSLFAWLVPIAFLLCGIGLITLLLREWRSNAENGIVGTGAGPWTPTYSLGKKQNPVGRGFAPLRRAPQRLSRSANLVAGPVSADHLCAHAYTGLTGGATEGRKTPPYGVPLDFVGVDGASPVPTIRTSQDDDLERYRAQLEAELAEDDVLFRKPVVGQSSL